MRGEFTVIVQIPNFDLRGCDDWANWLPFWSLTSLVTTEVINGFLINRA